MKVIGNVTNGQLQKQLATLQKAVNKLTGSLKNHVAHVEPMLQSLTEGRVIKTEKDVKKTTGRKGKKSKGSVATEWYQCSDCAVTRASDIDKGITVRLFKGKNAKRNSQQHKKLNPKHTVGIYKKS